MANLSDIRFHINSIKKTRQITNAMYLVSTSRMRKALRGIERNRAYFLRALDCMTDIRKRVNINHPYLTKRDADKTAMIVVAGEKGLSGSYNNDVLAFADDCAKKHEVVHIFAVGNIAVEHFKRQGYAVNENFTHIAERPSVNTARRIVSIIMDMYDRQQIDSLRVVYTHFINALIHKPKDVGLLPLSLDSFGAERDIVYDMSEMLYDPSPEEVFDSLVPQFIIGYIFGALVHSYASENYERMGAMESATRSADEMLLKLTQQYHAARQLAITNEISEIVAAAHDIWS